MLAFGVVASMLLATGFPVFVIFFFGIFAYFLYRIFSSGPRNETRDIFEFYLAANEMLRDDGRAWFGFEVKEAVNRGEAIVNRMNGAPPLVHFALGALYHKAGEYQSAINSLTHAVESDSGQESAYVFPTPELRNYVKILRKIEREPAEAPLTSSAIRSLERMRRLRGKSILDESRAAYLKNSGRVVPRAEIEAAAAASPVEVVTTQGSDDSLHEASDEQSNGHAAANPASGSHSRDKRPAKQDAADPYAARKPITEVLHDIYDKNVQ